MKIASTISAFLLAGNLLAQTESVPAALAAGDGLDISATKVAGTAPPHFGNDISLLQKAFAVAPKVRLSEQFALSRENPNELQAVLSGLFLFYKSFFSSQDNQRCSFHPSCSEYGLEAVKKFGVVRGIIGTFDRLTRCNGFSPEQYDIDMQRRVLKDPVEW
ncbi:MAG: membrane protein insertion efficiency factor YidD [Saprospiraceae bacterium]